MDRPDRTLSRLALALLLLGSLAACRSILKAALIPDKGFEEMEKPSPPDYNDENTWAALPDRQDEADAAPTGSPEDQIGAAADVFFIHPTTYASDDFWNQPIYHQKTNKRTDTGPIKKQASAFNRAGRVFAPRYRQMTLGAFFADRMADREAAFALAYRDVREAFRTYLRRWGGSRPIIIAGHSQGARHALRLLAEFFSEGAKFGDEALRERLVAAYLIGSPVPADALEETIPGVPVCEAADQTGCLITWNTVEAGESIERLQTPWVWYPGGHRTVSKPDLLCVNPVSWKTDGAKTPSEAHRGAVLFGENEKPEPDRGVLTAQCRGGLLHADVMDDDYGGGILGSDYHLVDYALFYMDIRENAAQRVDAFLAQTSRRSGDDRDE